MWYVRVFSVYVLRSRRIMYIHHEKVYSVYGTRARRTALERGARSSELSVRHHTLHTHARHAARRARGAAPAARRGAGLSFSETRSCLAVFSSIR